MGLRPPGIPDRDPGMDIPIGLRPTRHGWRVGPPYRLSDMGGLGDSADGDPMAEGDRGWGT